jgi:hypothetical protein
MLYDKKWDRPLVESETVEILKRARDRIEFRWCPAGGSDSLGGVCALNAIGRDYDNCEELFASEAMHLFRHAIGGKCIPEWNDAPGRTQGEVIAAFDRAIALARRDA